MRPARGTGHDLQGMLVVQGGRRTARVGHQLVLAVAHEQEHGRTHARQQLRLHEVEATIPAHDARGFVGARHGRCARGARPEPGGEVRDGQRAGGPVDAQPERRRDQALGEHVDHVPAHGLVHVVGAVEARRKVHGERGQAGLLEAGLPAQCALDRVALVGAMHDDHHTIRPLRKSQTGRHAGSAGLDREILLRHPTLPVLIEPAPVEAEVVPAKTPVKST